MRVGVVGLGVVGAATGQLLSRVHPVATFDTNGTGTCDSPEALAAAADVAFVCVPTPPGLMGRLDTSVVRHVCLLLRDVPVTVVRSTVPVGVCSQLHGTVVYWPEFCNARSAYDDMVAADYQFLAGPPAATAAVRAVLEKTQCRWRVVETPRWEDAEALKLVTNAAMAVKVAFANEAKAVVAKLGADWDAVSQMLAQDERLGRVGWLVPGPDGKPGFGGACLPKDLAGFVAQGYDAKVKTTLAEAAQAVNKRVRPPEGKK